MICQCNGPGFCLVLQREQSLRTFQICHGDALSPEKRAGYIKLWMMQSNCIHRGDIIGKRIQAIQSKTCASCIPRGTEVSIYSCSIHGQCSIRRWHFGQPEAICFDCKDKQIPQAKAGP